MQSLYWDKPVRIGDITIFGPLAAHDFLNEDWPEKKDSRFGTASLSILAALNGRGSPDVAREHFEKALRSAEMVTE